MKLIYALRNSVFYPYYGGDRELPPSNLRHAYLTKVKSMGFEGLELSLDCLGGMDTPREKIEKLRMELEEAGLPCLAIRCKGRPKERHEDSRKRALLAKGVEVASWFGAPIMNTTVTTPTTPGKDGEYRGFPVSQGSSKLANENDFVKTSETIAETADIAVDQGVGISIEVHQNSIVDNSWSALRLLKMIDRPNVGINPDVKNMYWTYAVPEENCDDAFVALAPFANYWHCKNITRVYLPKEGYSVFVRHPLPLGEINYRFAVSAMLDAGYKGVMAIEGSLTGDQLYIDGQSAAYAKTLIDDWYQIRDTIGRGI